MRTSFGSDASCHLGSDISYHLEGLRKLTCKQDTKVIRSHAERTGQLELTLSTGRSHVSEELRGGGSLSNGMVAITVGAQEPGTDCQGALHERRVPRVTERWWLERSEEKEGEWDLPRLSGGMRRSRMTPGYFIPGNSTDRVPSLHLMGS